MTNKPEHIGSPDVFSELGVFVLTALFALVAAFLAGWFTYAHFHPKPTEQTWSQIVQAMPPSIIRDIAIDFCVANKRMCRTMPLSSPINPADGGVK